MSTQIIPIQESHFNGELQKTVNARDLHLNLKSKRQFGNWIQDRIGDFIEGVDFLTELLKTNGRPLTEYHLTIEMAKHIAMIERSEEGKKIRQYFIEIEKQYKAPLQLTQKQQALLLAKSLIEAEEKIEILEIQKLNYENTFNHIADSKNLRGIRETANELGIGEQILIKFIKSKGWIQKVNGVNTTTSYSKTNGYAQMNEVLNHTTNRYYNTYKITQKGFIYLVKRQWDLKNVRINHLVIEDLDQKVLPRLENH